MSLDLPESRALALDLTADPAALPRLHRIELVLRRDCAVVTVSGEVDVLAAPALTRVFDSLAGLHLPIQLDLTAVAFVDSAGLEPVVAAVRDRRRRGMPALRVVGRSPAVVRLLDACGLGAGPGLDVAAWDRLRAVAMPGASPLSSGRQLN